MAHLRHGRLNHIFELPGVKYQLRPGPIAHSLKKTQGLGHGGYSVKN
jgi:hypothetical protein